MLSILRFFGCGLAMGTADIIPGVSGGTMAFILGIYERLIGFVKGIGVGLLADALRGQWGDVKRTLDIGFILPLLLGILSGILVMVKVVDLPGLMQAHPEPVYGVFFGLILGSVLVLFDGPKGLGRTSGLLMMALGVAIGLWVVMLSPESTPETPEMIFFAGMIAISAMLLPGISGSFILLIMGKYVLILEAIGEADFSVLGPFLAGCVVGILLFSRVIGFALAKFHDATISLIAGMLLGTLWGIWPFQAREFMTVRGKEKLIGSQPYLPSDWGSAEVLIPVVCMMAGVIAVLVMQLLARKKA